MEEFLAYKILELIKKQETIGSMFKLGFSYTNIAKCFSHLEDLGYIYVEEDSSKFITQKGEEKLQELVKKYKNKEIGKLEQYRRTRMKLEEIYLP